MTPAAATASAEPPTATAPRPTLQRARGLARLSVVAVDGRSRLAGLHQAGSSRIRQPRTTPAAPVEAVLLNTAGGMTGGDRFETEITVGPGASAVITSQAAERIYRSPEGTARVDSRLTVSGDGCLAWMPQETIIFNRSALDRSLNATIDGSATLIALEAVILGRTAMGERLTDIHLADAWRIRRDGRLVFADTTRLEGDSVSVMNGAATGNGAVAFATLVVAAPDAGRHLDPLRAALDGMAGEAGASVFDGLLVARMIAANGQALRAMAVRAMTTIRDAAMPRVWTL
jgi:urease accessory protein